MMILIILLETIYHGVNFKNKTVLITGGNGFIASYMLNALLKANKKYKLNLKFYP